MQLKNRNWIAITLILALAFLHCSRKKQNADTILLGGNYELTGGVATFGKSSLNGAMLAIDNFNAAGGLSGKKIEFIPMDNKSEATEATSVTSKLADKGVDAIIGVTISGTALASVQVADDNRLLLISSSATNPDVTVDPRTNQARPYVFRACFIDPFQGTVMANFALKHLKAKTAVILVDTAAPYSKGLAKFFREAFEQGGGKLLLPDEGYMTKDQDFRATLTKIRKVNPDVVFVPGYYQEVGLIVKQARELGMQAPFLGGDGWDSPDLVKIAGHASLNNTYYSNHYSPDQPDPLVQKFVKEYKQKYGEIPDAMAVLGYDSALLYIEALKKAGSAEPDKVKAALEGMKDISLVTGRISFDAKHNPIKSAVILGISGGQSVYKDSVQP